MPLTLTLPHLMLAARKQSKGETEADDATSVEAEQPTLPYCRRFMIRFIDATLRGASQVVIINNPCSGILIICSLFFPSPIIGVHGVLGLVGATVAAFLLQLDVHAVSSGLFGYNGLLVGMAFATFLSNVDVAVAVATVLMGGLSTVLNLALGNALVPTFKSPPFTLAFNITMILFLLASSHFTSFAMPHHAPVPPAAAAPTDASTAAVPTIDAGFIFRSALVSVGQVFLCESPVSGVLILTGMCISSRIAACAAYFGALLGTTLALALGVDHAAIGAGLWGYNSCLTAIAALTFFVPSLRNGLICAPTGVALTVLLDAALRTAAASLHIPIGTLPFCFASITLMLTHSSIPGFTAVPLASVSTAEDHLYAARVSKVTEISAANGDVAVEAVAPMSKLHIDVESAQVDRDEAHPLPRPSLNDTPGSSYTPTPRAELSDVMVTAGMREALVLSPRCTPLSSPVRSRNSSVHGTRRYSFNTINEYQGPVISRNNSTSWVSSNSPGKLRNLHGGSLHGERYVERQLEAMENSGHGGRVAELAIRAAGAMGIPPKMLSPQATVHGGDAFASLIEHEETNAPAAEHEDLQSGLRI